MNPTWRNPTVVALCEFMRQRQDYNATSILADALQDADFRDEEFLKALRDPLASPVIAEMLVARIYSDESANAVEWIIRYAKELGEGGYPGNLPQMTYVMLMEAAHSFVKTGDAALGAGSMNWSNASCDEPDFQEFWRKYEIVTGTPAPSDDLDSFFECHC